MNALKSISGHPVATAREAIDAAMEATQDAAHGGRDE
jgi:hypothetical protein